MILFETPPLVTRPLPAPCPTSFPTTAPPPAPPLPRPLPHPHSRFPLIPGHTLCVWVDCSLWHYRVPGSIYDVGTGPNLLQKVQQGSHDKNCEWYKCVLCVCVVCVCCVVCCVCCMLCCVLCVVLCVCVLCVEHISLVHLV